MGLKSKQLLLYTVASPAWSITIPIEDQASLTTFLKHSDTLKHRVSGSALNTTFDSIPSWHQLQETAEKRPRKKSPSQQQIVSSRKTVLEPKYSYSYPNSRDYRLISSTF